jgi:hypothetical protein
MILCQILYVSDNDKDNKDKFDKEDEEKADKDKVNNYSAKVLGDRLKKIGFNVGEVCENVGFDETLKIIYEKMFSVSEVTAEAA